jgi:hypothetical protein
VRAELDKRAMTLVALLLATLLPSSRPSRRLAAEPVVP